MKPHCLCLKTFPTPKNNANKIKAVIKTTIRKLSTNNLKTMNNRLKIIVKISARITAIIAKTMAEKLLTQMNASPTNGIAPNISINLFIGLKIKKKPTANKMKAKILFKKDSEACSSPNCCLVASKLLEDKTKGLPESINPLEAAPTTKTSFEAGKKLTVSLRDSSPSSDDFELDSVNLTNR